MVYNFHVEDFHTYLVSSFGIIVHNKCIVRQDGVRVDVRTSNEHGLPHAHISDGNIQTTVGLNRLPMPGHPALTKKMLRIMETRWKDIADGITKYFPSR